VNDLDKIMNNYKTYSESHKQNIQLTQDLKKIKSEYNHNNQILKRDQEFIK